MKTMTCVLAILAAVSTAAVAKDQDKKTTPTPSVNANVMNDADMDKVTAGDPGKAGTHGEANGINGGNCGHIGKSC